MPYGAVRSQLYSERLHARAESRATGLKACAVSEQL